jgi:hypothetical protein
MRAIAEITPAGRALIAGIARARATAEAVGARCTACQTPLTGDALAFDHLADCPEAVTVTRIRQSGRQDILQLSCGHTQLTAHDDTNITLVGAVTVCLDCGAR